MSTLKLRAFTATLGACAVGLTTAQAQVSFSIDYQGATISAPDFAGGIPITEGDILAPILPPFPGPPPAIVISGGPAGLGLPAHPAAVGHPPGIPGFVEVDALSYGTDTIVDQNGVIFPITWIFSVDEFAFGLQPPPPAPPNVSTEGAFGFPALPPPGQEASADLFSSFPPGAIPPGIYPLPPFAAPPGNIDLMDGDGFGPLPPPFLLNLLEPNIPSPGPFNERDNLDAVDIDTVAGTPGFPVYYSLDSNGAVFDFIDGFPGSGSAGANGGFSGADILVTFAVGAVPAVWAPAPLLGLDNFGFDTDDVDALIYWDNGDGMYTPPTGPYSWMGGATDMLFFSVRRGSFVIGAPDFFFGAPITEGDVLMPPPPGSPAGTPPGIWLSAETLGLCTVRPPAAPVCPPAVWGVFSDDLDALDVAPDCDDDGIPDPIAIMVGISPDCNCNGIPDACDLASGCLHDDDFDGVPDECECPSDINCDGAVNVVDLLRLLGDWGPCP